MPGIPPSDPHFRRLYARRNHSESINRGIENTLYLKRASGKGWRRQLVDLLGFARLTNALTLARCRAREQILTAA